MRGTWRLGVLSALLSLGGNIAPVVAQQTFLLAEKPQLLGNYLGDNSKVSIAGVAVDTAGNIYLAGATSSADLRTNRAVQSTYGGGTDAFIIKLDPAGNVLYASYLGGGAQDWATGIAVDSANNAYVTGWTASSDFPTRSAAQSSLRGRRNGFAAKFSPDGVLIYSTYLGGTGDDSAAAIAVDSGGNAYVTGAAASPDFPVVRAIQSRTGGGVDAFVTKLGAFGDIQYSTYIGGGALDRGQGIAVDSAGRAYIAGVTASYDFPFKNPFRGYSGGTDGFIARLNAAGDGLEYATWIGGSGNEEVSGVAVDALGRAYVTGWTDSRDFPLVHPVQGSLRGIEGAFVIRLTPSGDGLSYSTYLGGSGADRGLAIAADAAGRAYVTGWQQDRNALQKAWLAELNPAGTQLDYKTYPGSGGADEGRAVALADSGDVFVAGETSTPANQDAFLVRFSPAVPAPLSVTIQADQTGNANYVPARGGPQPFTTGSEPQTITFGALADVTYGKAPFTIKATASSGLRVTFSAATRTVCMVAGDLVTVLGTGTCSIQASQAGNVDFAPATTVTQNFTVKPANPSGTLTEATGSPITVGKNAYAAAVGDFDGDGIQDLAVANINSGNVTVLLGNGSGGFSAALGSPISVGSGPAAIAVADFDGDGKLDLVTANATDGNVTVLLGNGLGGFSAATGSPFTAGTQPLSVAVGDFNGDGIPDLAIANTVSDDVTVLLGNGSGGFSAATGSPFGAGTQPVSIAVGDFHGDGIQDLAIVNNGSDNVTVLLGNGSGSFSEATGSPFTVGKLPFSVAVGDFDGNGVPDLAIANSNSIDVTVLLGNGSGGFSEATGSPFYAGAQPLSVVVGDFNGDGIQDLAAANGFANNVMVLLGNGSGGFSPGTSIPFAAGMRPRYVAAGDFNGDGRTDLAAVNYASSNVTILLGGSAATGSVLSAATASTVAGGTPIPLTLTVSDSVTAFNPLTGAVTFSDGSTVLGVATQTASPYTFTTAGLTVGSHTLTATYSGDTRSLGSNSNNVTIRVGVPQTIAFAALPTQIVDDPPFTLAASASSGLAVAFASNSTGICTVSGSTVTLVAAGACSITASQPGDNVTWGPAAPVTVTFTVDTSFGDVSIANESQAFITAIDDMLSKGITSGCTTVPFAYCPSLNVTRGQMAVFIIRSIYGSNNFAYNPTPYFTDATPTSVGAFFPYIQKMHELGITSGCTGTTYCPDLNVTRGQMAVFIIRARYGTGFNFDFPTTPYFTDATTASVGSFFKYIQRMKVDNITSGCTQTTYCPDLIVTRDQMAVFMIRGGFNKLLPPTEPIISGAAPATGGLGETINVTLTGVNTNFVQDTTTVTAGAGLTVGTVTVNSLTSLTVQLTIASNATPNPVSLLVTTGMEEAVLPNGFTITSDPAAGAIAYWTGNGTTLDSVSAMNGTLTNGATYASATSRTFGLPDAQAFSLNGTNSYVQAAAGETGTVSGGRTLAAWVYTNPFSGLAEPILTGGNDIFGITGTTGTCSTGGQYQLYVDHGGTACYVSDISLAPGVWSFVAVTFDGSKVVFYIDAVPSVTVPGAQMNNYGLATLEIGGNTLGGTSSGASFNGLLSEVQIYNRALTPAEIQGLYTP